MTYRIIIHVGPWKTGSTSLQDFFYRNSTILLDQGVLYPRGKIVENAHHEIPNTITNSMSRFVGQTGGSLQSLNEIVSDYYDQLKLNAVTTLLLSSEDFAGLNEEYFNQLLESFGKDSELSFELIYFDFEPEERFTSYRNQFISQGEFVDEDSARVIRESIEGIIPKLEKAISSLPVVIHRLDYSELRNPNDIFERMLRIILSEKQWHLNQFSIENSLRNSSLSLDLINFHNEFNRLNVGNRSFDFSCPVRYSTIYPEQTLRLRVFRELLDELRKSNLERLGGIHKQVEQVGPIKPNHFDSIRVGYLRSFSATLKRPALTMIKRLTKLVRNC